MIDLFNEFDKFSNKFKFAFNLILFSSFIASMKQTLQSVCWWLPFPLILLIHAAQHNLL